MKCGELCTREVVICNPETPLVEAARLMREFHVGALVVVEEEDGRNLPVAVVTDRDLVVDGIAEDPEGFASLTVARVMTSELVTTRESEDVATLLLRMRSQGIRRVPVVDDEGVLLGILCYDDVIEWVAEQLTGLTAVLRSELARERGRLPSQ